MKENLGDMEAKWEFPKNEESQKNTIGRIGGDNIKKNNNDREYFTADKTCNHIIEV